ncbi:KR domain-containing protein, partial [Salmonella enterica subsp. enterica serovar Weltevreden]|nr:KR domain-containing protein [Salmonella enterica subsp. enterica serovar Weltevreden]
DMLANSYAGEAKGVMFDDRDTLRKLIGRPTTTLTESLRSVL